MIYPVNARLVLLTAVLLQLFLSCKKEEKPLMNAAERTADQLVKDSVYHYFKQYSLWSGAATAEDAAVAAFTDNHDGPLGVLNALKGTTPFHAAYRGSIDRFSYLDDEAKQGLMAASSAQANTGFGLFLSIGAVSDTMAYPVVYLVEGGSPAAQAGIRRSDLITGIDEVQDLGIPVACGAGGCKVIDELRQQTVINRLLKAMEQQSMRISLRHADDSEGMVSLSAQRYEVNPVIKETVLSSSGKPVGYLALSSFEAVDQGQINRYRLDQVFEDFENKQVEALILDLRYNTGGYISAAEYLANKVIGPDADQALMYRYALNAHLSQRSNWKGQSFEDVHFRRNNTLNLNTVYFLVTDITASAAELLINVLRPYMKVVIIAEHEGTYGKPVGFFKQEIMGRTALWVASFKLLNSRGEGDYWDGIAADQRQVTDYIFRDFGDAEESMISAALRHTAGKVSAAATLAKSPKIRLPARPKALMVQVNAVPEKNMLKN